MSQTYLLTTDPDRYGSLLVEPGWGDNLSMLDGTPCRSNWIPVPMERRPGRRRKLTMTPLDFPSLMGMGMGVSQRALDLLNPLCGDAFEALPLDCYNDKTTQYYVLNILDLVDCLDEEHSKVHRFEGKILWIHRYAFKPGTTEGHHLFKTIQVRLGKRLCSPELKRRIEESGLVGAVFREIGQEQTAQ